MAKNRVICTEKQVNYASIRKAMCEGARTTDELREKTGLCGACAGCMDALPDILSSVCGCKKVSLETVVQAVKDGADTVDKVVEQTGAGTGEDCGRCKALIANVIALGR